jgi:hypothetical protein
LNNRHQNGRRVGQSVVVLSNKTRLARMAIVMGTSLLLFGNGVWRMAFIMANGIGKWRMK